MSGHVPARPQAFDAIDHVLALDLGGRGIARFFTPGAALGAARALRRARAALVVTGFCVPPGLPETDGPPGAAVLGRALRRLGVRVRYVTDAAVVGPLGAALRALDEPVDVVTYPDTPDAALALLAREQPTHLVAVERPGRCRSGDYLSARGESVAAWNRPLDELFLIGGDEAPPPIPPQGLRRRSRRIEEIGGGEVPPPIPPQGLRRRSRRSNAGRYARPVTIGVGDGGNEVGMGNVRARLAGEGALMARIASTVRVDHLVVAGTSNWGAYGIVAALERLTGRPLLHTPALERRLVEACAAAGAVDGILRCAQATVDGLPLEVHAAVVELLRRAAPDGPARRDAIRRTAPSVSPRDRV